MQPQLTSPPPFEYATPAIWSDATYDLSTETRGRVARGVVDPAEAANMLSAGYLRVSANQSAVLPAKGKFLYAEETNAQCSMTVRDREGTGSGWAGLSSYDWSRIDAEALAARALEKCLASRNPVALEPGRYTVILEPQAVHGLTGRIIDALIQSRGEIEFFLRGPFAAGYDNALQLGKTKLGLKRSEEHTSALQSRLHVGCR